MFFNNALLRFTCFTLDIKSFSKKTVRLVTLMYKNLHHTKLRRNLIQATIARAVKQIVVVFQNYLVKCEV